MKIEKDGDERLSHEDENAIEVIFLKSKDLLLSSILNKIIIIIIIITNISTYNLCRCQGVEILGVVNNLIKQKEVL